MDDPQSADGAEPGPGGSDVDGSSVGESEVAAEEEGPAVPLPPEPILGRVLEDVTSPLQIVSLPAANKGPGGGPSPFLSSRPVGGPIRVWNTVTGMIVVVLQDDPKDDMVVYRMAADPSGNGVFAMQEDGRLRRFSRSSGACDASVSTSGVGEIVVLRDGRVAVAAGDSGGVEVWTVGTTLAREPDVVLEGHTGAVRRLMEVHDVLVTAGTDGIACAWDVGTGDCVATLEGHTGHVLFLDSGTLPGPVREHTHGDVLVTSGLDGAICVWQWEDVMDGVSDPFILTGHHGAVSAMLCVPLGRQVVTGGVDTTARVWDLESGACHHVLEGHDDAVCALAVVPEDGRLVTASKDAMLRVWDLGSGECTALLRHHTNWVTSLALLPDDVVAASSLDGTISCWQIYPGWFRRKALLEILCMMSAAGPGKVQVLATKPEEPEPVKKVAAPVGLPIRRKKGRLRKKFVWEPKAWETARLLAMPQLSKCGEFVVPDGDDPEDATLVLVHEARITAEMGQAVLLML